MASIMRAILLLALLVLPLAHADVGPSPAPPKVTVHLTEGGQFATSITQLTYHCLGTDERNESGAVTPYPVNFSCSGGTCTNDQQWYYKFNPCFGFPDGYFTYQYGGSEVRTEDLSALFGGSERKNTYYVEIEASTGQLKSGSVSDDGSCPLTMILLPAILACGFWKRG